MLHRWEPDNISRQLNNFGALSGILWDNLVNIMAPDIFDLCLDINNVGVVHGGYIGTSFPQRLISTLCNSVMI